MPVGWAQKRRWARSAWALGGILLAAVAGEATMRRRAPSVGCPFHGRGAPPGGGVAALVSRSAELHVPPGAQVGHGPAAHTRILGLALGEAHRDDLAPWAAMHGLRCRDEKRTGSVACTTDRPDEVSPEFAAATALEVQLDSNAEGVLCKVRTLARYAQAQAAAEALLRAGAATELQAGPPYERRGTPSSAYLSAGALRQARLHYARDNLVAQLSATNFGASFHVVQSMQLR